MGIRVDEKALHEQLLKAGCPEREKPSLPPDAVKRRAALHHRRRYRPVQTLHAPSLPRPHRRGTGQHLAEGNAERVRRAQYLSALMQSPAYRRGGPERPPVFVLKFSLSDPFYGHSVHFHVVVHGDHQAFPAVNHLRLNQPCALPDSPEW